MAIKPIDLPSAAGLEFGKGDVRHFAEGDAVNPPGLSNPTRQLAERDNLLAARLNEVIQTVNNQEQFVPVPLVRTVAPPNDEVVVTNYRIPEGYESRVLNAVVGAVPSSADIELNIYYGAGFGGSTGTNIVSTSSEFTGGVQFYQEGEFIITLKNKGSVDLDVVASVLLTLRPIGAQGTLLVGTVIQGQKGNPGQKGPPGPAGAATTGGAGSPGMVWRGDWSASTPSYAANDVVSYPLYGTLISSFISNVGHAPVLGVNDPQTSYGVTWDAVALGANGATGATGAGLSPGVEVNTVNAELVAGADWQSGPVWGDYTTTIAALGTATFSLTEVFAGTKDTGLGAAFLFGNVRANCTGSGTIHLPLKAGGAKANYTNSSVYLMLANNGTTNTEGVVSATTGSIGGPLLVQRNAAPNDHKFTVKVLTPTPTRVSMAVFGASSV